MEAPIKVSLYEDDTALRCSLSNLFGTSPQFELIGAYPNATSAIENCLYRKPDVIIMDIEMPGISGIEAVANLKASFHDIKILMLTVFDDDQKVFHSICNGAVGYILKKTDPMEILEAVKDAHEGGGPMSPSIAIKVLQMFRIQAPGKQDEIDLNEREREILSLLTRGFSYKMISTECQLSIDTVRFYIKKIYKKLHVHSMTEAVSKALKNKWV